jgi:hypothetical protein
MGDSVCSAEPKAEAAPGGSGSTTGPTTTPDDWPAASCAITSPAGCTEVVVRTMHAEQGLALVDALGLDDQR